MTNGTGSVVMATSGRFAGAATASAWRSVQSRTLTKKRAAMNSRRPAPFLLALALAFAAAPMAAAAGEAITDCVDLGNDQEIVRAAGGQQFFLRNGSDHYRVAFQQSCSSITTTSRIDISTEGQANRLCADDTRVQTNRDTCRVASVETISAEEFTKRKKRSRR
ncbi:hypothetical protein [Pseudoxanthomonas putridarboris]|uniref:Uncharacterized protein n=1 Tax=Pseudoxanthomonas putridarboris TaxID=752605 RepID=A0ABU9IZV9_9GAMM